jgi:hypothetical protein
VLPRDVPCAAGALALLIKGNMVLRNRTWLLAMLTFTYAAAMVG